MAIPQTSSLREHYSQFYRRTKDHDSPRESRTRMVAAMTTHLLSGGERPFVLNIGSGRRDLEGALQRNARGAGSPALRDRLKDGRLVSFDIADISPHRLIGRAPLHVQADSRAMPFASERFDLTVSNLSIDMLRRDDDGGFETALSEAARVTKLGGAVLLNYHPPELFETLSGDYEKADGYVADYYNGNAYDNPYYQSADDIASDLEAVGLEVDTIEFVSDRHDIDSWWEVAARKRV